MLNDIFISNEVVIYFLVESIVFLLLIIALYHSFVILKNWDFKSVSNKQYDLEKRSYLVTLLILFSLSVKILVYPYFVLTLDVLSNVIPGAMCAAGVLTSNIYGEPLFIVKSIVILAGGIWIVLNSLDLKSKSFIYFRKKFIIYLFLFVLLSFEIALDILYFTNLSTVSLVTCCSAIFSATAKNSLPFNMDLQSLLITFYTLYIFLMVSNYKKNSILSGILSLSFLVISYYAVIYFFGTYIYQLPTHHCPFCMMQYDYLFIGYFIFLTLFLGFFYSFINFALKAFFVDRDLEKGYLYGNIFSTLFVFIVTSYVVVYYIKNGVFL